MYYKEDKQKKVTIECIETGEIFKTLCDASKKYNLPVSNISSCLHGKRKTCGGFHWRFV